MFCFLISAGLVPVFLVIRWAIESDWNQELGKLAALWRSDRLWLGWLMVLAIIGSVLLAARASRRVSRLGFKFLIVVVGLLGPGVVFGLYLVLCLWWIDSPFVDGELVRASFTTRSIQEPLKEALAHKNIHLSQAKLSARRLFVRDGWTTYILSEDSNSRDAKYTVSRERLELRQKPSPLGLQTAAFESALESGTVEPLRRSLRESGISLPPGASLLLDGIDISDGDRTYVISREANGRYTVSGLRIWDGHREWAIVGIIALLLVLNSILAHQNVTSAHGFYRDRLSLAYLIRMAEDGEVVPNDGQRLSELNVGGSAASYHLINVALNLNGSKDPNVRGRQADFFVFSKRYTGSERTGFCETSLLEGYDSRLNLGTAFAISGAAAAPNMGKTTIKPLVFIMTLLNIRLGYWLPNPGVVQEASWIRRARLHLGAGPRYLLKEALGRVDARGLFVNVSDGGHVENLGVYQLLERRCRLILAVDAEADPELTFGGLVTLMRYAEIDMGIRIDVDLSPFQKDANGFVQQQWAVWNIDYGGGETGQLLYIKSSLKQGEAATIEAYSASHPAFPHQSTADQFFDETQFESYRSLGYSIADRLCQDPTAIQLLRSG